MRVTRLLLSSFALAGAALACSHDDPVLTPFSRDGNDTIAIVTLAATGGGFPTGKYGSISAFDTSITDAFGRGTTNPPYFMADPKAGVCYSSNPLIYEPHKNVKTYVGPHMFLPALAYDVTLDDVGCGDAVGYIIPASQGDDGGAVWEIWHDWTTPAPDGTRYISGFVRYALVQRGALDPADVLLNGSVTANDSLVFMAGDFNPAGRKDDSQFHSSCTTSQHIPTGGPNPILLGGGTSGGGGADIDQTICANGAGADTNWANGLGAPNSPVPANNATRLGPNQYNFFVIWEALADSTPDYTKPVYRFQMGPLVDINGNVINNANAPIPTPPALTHNQLLALPGSAPARPDSVWMVFSNVKHLASGAYQAWLVNSDSGTAGMLAEFNPAAGATRDSIQIPFKGTTVASAHAWNNMVLAVQATAGASSLPARPSEPLWGKFVTPHAQGTTAYFAGNMRFGSFDNGAADSTAFLAGGTGTGGFFGLEFDQDLTRLPRPPLGYEYEGWLTSSSDTSKYINTGVLRGPGPSYVSLAGADTMTALPVSGNEVTEAIMRFTAGTYAAYCKIGAIDTVKVNGVITSIDTTVAAIYDEASIRLAPKGGDAGSRSPAVVLSGPIGVPGGAVTHKHECQ
ncbi:MAG TPA: hypothetical protein VFK78_07050 [Gemmatimonadales bacterium]|nr:hypothetical protein [Gemmatimonadales bacterium]